MTGYPRRYIVLDTETWSRPKPGKAGVKELTLRLGVALIVDPYVYGDREDAYMEFTSSEHLWSMLDTLPLAKEPIYAFAHNMGFDSRIIALYSRIAAGDCDLLPSPETPRAKSYKTPLFIADSSPFIVRTFRPDGQRFIWLDTVQWFHRSLAEIGEMIGHKKGTMPTEDESNDVWFKYCKNDVFVLNEALKRLWGYLQSHYLPRFEHTPAMQSMAMYRIRYERKRIIRPKDQNVLGLDRIGYYGGYLDCFRVGKIKGPIYEVDVNALYPFVMENNLFPCKVDEGIVTNAAHQPPGDIPDEVTTAEVWLDSRHCPYPVRFQDQTCYCTGKVHTVLCGPELYEAWRSGHIAKWGQWTRYKTADLFSGFMAYWRRSRTACQNRRWPLEAAIAKDLANCLHGKFGQRIGRWQYQGKNSRKGAFLNGRVYCNGLREWVDMRVLDGHEYERAHDEEDPRGFVPIAAWTASYGRVYMDRMMDLAGRHNVLYIATDSLLLLPEGYHTLKSQGLVDTGEWGGFKTVGIHDEVTLWNINQLDLGDRKVRSGVKRGSLEIAPGVWSTERWEGCADGVFSTGQDRVSVTTMLVAPSLRYWRREVLQDGMTQPWSINCWNASIPAISGSTLSQWME